LALGFIQQQSQSQMTANLSPVARPSNAVDITREDLASIVSVYKRNSKRLNSFGALGVLGGVVAALTMIGIGHVTGMADDWIPFFIFLMYGLGAISLALEWVSRRRMVDRIQIYCVACSEPLLGSGNPRKVTSRAQAVVISGCCSHCGRSFVANEA
jgi:hypothetical protein